MIIAAALAVLPCLTSAPPPVRYAKPWEPQYVAMTHIRILPPPICEPIAPAPLADGPGEPIALAEAPLAPPVPMDAPEPPYAPLVWGPIDWPADEGCGCGGFGLAGGGWFGGGGGWWRPGPPPIGTVTPVPEPGPLALLGLGLLATGAIARRRR